MTADVLDALWDLISVLTPEPKAVYPAHKVADAYAQLAFQCSPLSRRLCTIESRRRPTGAASISVLTPEPKAVYPRPHPRPAPDTRHISVLTPEPKAVYLAETMLLKSRS